MVEKFGRDYYYGRKKSNYSNYETIDFPRQFKAILEFMRKTGAKRFLDVGCAFGYLVNLALPYVKEAHGCDASHFAVKKAKSMFPRGKFKVSNLEKDLSYPNEYFDVITALDILEHTKSIKESMKNIIKKLRPGGYLIISLPFNGKLRLIMKHIDKDVTHISVIPEKELLEIISSCGLDVVKKLYFLPVPYFTKIYGIPAEIELYLRKPY
ncbi:MAG: class I SAM-dependent methyltransferase [Candidatus Aenigmarchaeota archaeon]|nr:class I SAM-dependent methyltransferase [Candidatus Aenigmarchaeota archaeon]